MMNGKHIGCYSHREFGSKFGSIHLRILQNKLLQQHENENNPQRCHVKILDKYFDVLPQGAKAKNVVNLPPLPKKPTELGKLWYTLTPVGRICLNSMMKDVRGG